MRGRGGGRDARTGRSTVRERAGRERRVLRVGLVLSILLHVVAIGVVGGLLDRRMTRRASPATPLIAEPPSGMRAVDIAPAPTVAPPEAVEEPRRPEQEEVVVVAPADAPPAEAVPDALSAADRLAPRLVDPRLWRPVVLLPREPTMADVQMRLDAALELLSDSALAATEREIRSRDWTVEDGSGGRWGISPGKLHLGKLTLPLPIFYAEEWDPERGEWYDLEAQVDRTLFLESFEDRVRAIRERRDRERRERKQEESGGAVAGSAGSGP